MTLVKSNLCPTCGGLLDIDLDKQIYVCPFCGVSFDYEYFREDNVKDVASKAIRRNEYGSAKDAYDFMLAKDPHDFEALRGLFICSNKWKTMGTMNNDAAVHVSADDPALKNAIDNCLPEHRPYFEKVREALIELKHYRDLVSEAEDISRNKSTEQSALGKLNSEYYHNSRQFTELCHEIWEMEDSKARESIISLVFILPILVLGTLIWNKAWAFLIFLAALIALIIGIYHLIKFINAKSLRSSMVPYEKKIKELTEQHEAKSEEARQSRNRYKELVKEFMDMDPCPKKADKDPSDE